MGSHRVERVCRVSKAPGVIVVSWLSYRESSRTLCRPVKLSLWTQLILLFLSILTGEGRTTTSACRSTVVGWIVFNCLITYNIRSPSRPRNILLRTESI